MGDQRESLSNEPISDMIIHYHNVLEYALHRKQIYGYATKQYSFVQIQHYEKMAQEAEQQIARIELGLDVE